MASYQVSSVITNAGITAAIEAGTTGPQIDVTGFQIGSSSAAQGAVALATDLVVSGLVYTGTTSQLSYTIVNQDTIKWTIGLDTTVGDFQVGCIGILITGGVLFCEAVLPGQSFKWADNPPTTVGNVKYYNVIMQLANVAALINLTILTSEDANIPEVPTELALPNPLTPPFDMYMVDNHTHIGVPTSAVRLNSNWWHAPHRLYPGQGQGVLATKTSMFDSGVTAPAAVYLSPVTNLFEKANGYDPNKIATGMLLSTFEVTSLGQVTGAACGLVGTLVPGTRYYVSNAGGLQTTPNGAVVAVATTATDVFINFCSSVPNRRFSLSGNTTFYVSTSGSDTSGDGTVGNPWQTPQYAATTIHDDYDLAGYVATIQMADGAYYPSNNPSATGSTIYILGSFTGSTGMGSVIFNGNAVTPGNVVVHGNGAYGISIHQGAQCTIQNMRINSTGTIPAPGPNIGNGGCAIWIGHAGRATISNIIFGICDVSHIACSYGGFIGVSGNYSIQGGAAYHVLAYSHGIFSSYLNVINYLGASIAFSTAFMQVTDNSSIGSWGTTFTGSAPGTCPKSVIATQGGNLFSNGAYTTFPGNPTVTQNTGGQIS